MPDVILRSVAPLARSKEATKDPRIGIVDAGILPFASLRVRMTRRGEVLKVIIDKEDP